MAIKDLKRRVLTFAWVFPAVMASLVYRPMMLTLGVAVAVLAADEYHLATRPGYKHCVPTWLCSLGQWPLPPPSLDSFNQYTFRH